MAKVRPSLETCPICECSGNLHVHSYYSRYLIDFINGKNVTHQIKVLRIQCDSCSTHAILPDFIIPYCSYSLYFILRVLAEYFLHIRTIDRICERFGITVCQLYKWISLFNKHKKLWLNTLSDTETSAERFLYHIEGSYSTFSMRFISSFSFSFLQSHANPKSACYCQSVFMPDY